MSVGQNGQGRVGWGGVGWGEVDGSWAAVRRVQRLLGRRPIKGVGRGRVWGRRNAKARARARVSLLVYGRYTLGVVKTTRLMKAMLVATQLSMPTKRNKPRWPIDVSIQGSRKVPTQLA